MLKVIYLAKSLRDYTIKVDEKYFAHNNDEAEALCHCIWERDTSDEDIRSY